MSKYPAFSPLSVISPPPPPPQRGSEGPVHPPGLGAPSLSGHGGSRGLESALAAEERNHPDNVQRRDGRHQTPLPEHRRQTAGRE